jgi:methyl-accepting chemotaxis protein
MSVDWLKNSRVAWRLAFGFGSILVLLAIATGVGLHGLRSLHGVAVQTLHTDVLLAQRAANIRVLILTARRFEKDAFINLQQKDKHASYRKRWTDNHAALTKEVASLKDMALADANRRATDLLETALPRYAGGFAEVLAAIDKGLIGTAEDANKAFDKHKQAVYDMDTTTTEINERASLAAQAAAGPIESQYRRTSMLMLGMALVCLFAAVVMCVVIARSIKGELGGEPSYVAKVVRRIADGDLATGIHLQRGDEDSLLAAVSQMRDRLDAIVSDIRSSSVEVAGGSSQIATGNADLSQRTEEQAANLQQTAASMEQLSATVKSTTDMALQATRRAGSANDVAARGGTAVQEVVSTMQQISACSRRITDIIGVIDSIAFQTNILALNAAVEAARAGTQGRGFAVVASEVRTLAQRSSEAAKEIKHLIADSSERVDRGSELVNHAGATMKEIVAEVDGVAQLIHDISLASGQQSAGIGQIGVAMGQLDTATQQNAAMVEESAAAADNLTRQANRLVESVSVFKVRELRPT